MVQAIEVDSVTFVDFSLRLKNQSVETSYIPKRNHKFSKQLGLGFIEV